ncbi:MAG: ABC transporter ATP-binding protein, partial [Oscillospiraceae bacterium]|nr:ABC transporter ATP-binding protein [Oscillospiraceae bacterium]
YQASSMKQTIAGYQTSAGKRIEIAEHLRYLPMGYFNRKTLGDITSVTTNTMEQLGDVSTRVIMMTTQGILEAALIAGFLLIFDWRIGLLAAGGILLFLLINGQLRRANQAVSGRKLQADTRLVEHILSYIQGIAEVKAYNLSGKVRQQLDQAIDANCQVNTELEILTNRYIPLQNIAIKLVSVGMSLASIGLYLNNQMQLAVCLVMMIASFMLFASLEQAGAYASLLRVVDLSVDRANEILRLEPMDIHGAARQTHTENLAAQDICFAYDQKAIIRGLSLQIPQHTTAAFVGPSGGGKTTLCHLLARFWDVSQGEVQLDQVNVRDYSMDSLMDHFSFVFQTVYLFHDTIANNIRFGKPDASLAEVRAAARQACCDDFITALPEGYDTVIGEGGASLSGGEKQRVSIARAILKDAPIIILDEATANVDPENEAQLLRAITALTRDKTILMIAHRLKTVEQADQIFVIDQGQIVQQGTHAELLAQAGLYRQFIAARRQAVSWKL